MLHAFLKVFSDYSLNFLPLLTVASFSLRCKPLFMLLPVPVTFAVVYKLKYLMAQQRNWRGSKGQQKHTRQETMCAEGVYKLISKLTICLTLWLALCCGTWLLILKRSRLWSLLVLMGHALNASSYEKSDKGSEEFSQGLAVVHLDRVIPEELSYESETGHICVHWWLQTL